MTISLETTETPTLLYIEDEPGAREQLGRMIALKGYNVLTASNGHEGLELYRTHHVDIVLTDIMMPVMNGLEMSREIRRQDPRAQIVVLTAYNHNEFLLDAIEIGITRFVLKPVKMDKLFDALEGCREIVLLRRRFREQHEHIHMLSDVLEQNPSITMITDTRGTIEYVNRKFCQVTGYGKEEVVGANARILSGDTPAGTYAELWETLREGREWHGLLHNRRKNGELYWEQCSISPYSLPGGQTLKFIKTAVDVTEQRRLERELQNVRHLEALGVLAGGLAHDFNNLLQIILGGISLARLKTPHDSPVQTVLDMAEKSSEEARALGRRLLELTREHEGVRSLLPLAPLVNAGIDSALDGTDIVTKLNLPPDLPPLTMNESQIRHVFYHLALNAREAMPGGGTLEINAQPCIIPQNGGQQLQPGRYIHISFADTGSGMPPDRLERIFEPYFSTKSLGCCKGQGLGLSICHAVIQRHGGSLTANSIPGKGTTFHLWLPTGESL